MVMLLINHIPLVMLGLPIKPYLKRIIQQNIWPVLSNNMVISSRLFMEECRRMGYKFWGPDVNESIINLL
jgi:undecaprenyl pyrophosphate phosphatase UppP